MACEMQDAVVAAVRMGLVGPLDYVVVVQRVHEDFCVKIVTVNESGKGIKRVVDH
jgi:pyruvate kinase